MQVGRNSKLEWKRAGHAESNSAAAWAFVAFDILFVCFET